MALFPLSAIWGLGCIHLYPRFNSQGNDLCTYPHCRTISTLDPHGSPFPSFKEKAKKRGQAYLDRFLSPDKIAQAPEEA